jgi:RNA polymerase-binding protein DksA
VAKQSVKRPSKTRATAHKAPAKSAAKSSAKPSVALKSAKSSKHQAAPAKASGKVIIAKAEKSAKSPISKPVAISVAPTKAIAISVSPSKLNSLNSKAVKMSRKNDDKQPRNHEPVSVPAPVPTDGKPRKNQAGITPKELEHYRELLLAKRRELVGDMSSMEREALRSTTGTNLSNLPLHMADMGTDNYEQEFTLGLVEKDRGLLREINQALAKIQDGTYGLCEGTSKPISKARLEAQPWAKFSIEHARMMERTGMGIRRV